MKLHLCVLLLTVFIVICCKSDALPAKIKSGGSRGSSSSGRGSSWSTWSRPASTNTNRQNTHTSSSSNVALSYPAPKPKPSAPEYRPHQQSSYPQSNTGLSGGSHSYPSNTGLSGGSHSYPSNTGLSGGSHSYPSNTGLSGGSHGYPASNGASGTGGYRPYTPGAGTGHSYPSNTGLPGSSGGITSTNVKPNYNAPASNPSYPSGTGLSGHATNVKPNYNAPSNPSHSYPTGTGLSGNSKPAYPQNTGLSGSHATNTNYRPNNGPPPPYQPAGSPGGYQPYSHNQPPPPYSPGGYGGYHAPSYSQPSYRAQPYGGLQAPPNYPVFTPSYQPVYVKSSGPGIGTSILTGALSGLATYNLVRAFSGSGSGSTSHVYHHYDDNRNRDYNTRPSSAAAHPPVSAKELSNCTLSVSDDKGGNSIIMIPCDIVTSFAPGAPQTNSSVPAPPPPIAEHGKEICTISVMRNGKNEQTTVPCDFLTNLANNVTEPPPPPRISCLEDPDKKNSDPNFTSCKFVDVLTDEESLKVIPLDNKIESPPPNPVNYGNVPKETTMTVNMVTESILMDDDPNVKRPETAPSA